jgi:MoxR-like ATPase
MASQVLTELKAARRAVLDEVHKLIVGQEAAVEAVLTALFAGGHCLISGPPATAKTALVSTLAKVASLDFKRIQFAPDLMPSDISGTEILEEDHTTGKRFVKFVQGPVFTNLLMADEINRTPPKTQAALLEVMQEKQVTIGGQTMPLPKPFFVLATLSSMEQEGSYNLPEAQQDRFMLSISMDYLTPEQEVQVVRQSTGAKKTELKRVISGEDLIRFAAAVRTVTLPPAIGTYIVDLVAATRPTVPGAPDFVKDYISWGAGLRASQNIALAAKSVAAQDGRDSVGIADVRKVIVPVLRHRIGLSFGADVDHVTVEQIIDRLLKTVPAPTGSHA